MVCFTIPGLAYRHVLRDVQPPPVEVKEGKGRGKGAFYEVDPLDAERLGRFLRDRGDELVFGSRSDERVGLACLFGFASINEALRQARQPT